MSKTHFMFQEKLKKMFKAMFKGISTVLRSFEPLRNCDSIVCWREKLADTSERPSNIFPSTLFRRYGFPFFFSLSPRHVVCASNHRETREEKGSTKGASLGGDFSPDNGNAIERTWHESHPAKAIYSPRSSVGYLTW